jgi:nicotinate-nucleotide pyrophosphorylase
MEKTLKTPSLKDVDFAKENTEIALKNYSSVHGETQINVEAESVEEAQKLIDAEKAKLDKSKTDNKPNNN